MPRKDNLMERRNRSILKRFNLLHRKGMRVDSCLKLLKEEFWLSERRIYDIILKERNTSSGPSARP
ncbi:MAG: hypothetical protein AAFX87_18555 [Bacteroidota bacterium]